tara:strand:- start:385 stop:1398 length:1014 start_codon:yes stop_codon:yes gene_type:complete
MAAIRIGGAGYGLLSSDNSRNLKWQGSTSTDVGFTSYTANGNHGWQMYSSGTAYGFLSYNWGAWDIRKIKGGALYLSNSTVNYLDGSSIVYPIYYDSANTAYYGDFASYTYGKYYGRIAHNEGFQVGGYNNIGSSHATSNPIHTIGSSYMPAVTTLSNMYGVGYTGISSTFINFTGQSDWGFYVAADGDARVWLDGSSGNICTAANVYAAAYYDTNTAYYLDPANTGTSLNVAGTGVFGGDVIAYSDKKLKTNIKTLDGSKVYKMRGVSFDRIDTGKHSSGVIAQEIQKIAPELVKDNSGTLAVAYGNLTGYLIEAVKELKKEIDTLKKEIDTLKNN